MAFDIQISLRPSRLSEPSIGLYEKPLVVLTQRRVYHSSGVCRTLNPKLGVGCHLSERKVFGIRVVGFGSGLLGVR